MISLKRLIDGQCSPSPPERGWGEVLIANQ